MLPVTIAAINMAMPWAASALVIAAAVVLLPLFLGPSKRILNVLRTNIFATTPLLVAILAALAAGPAGSAVEGAQLGAIVGAGALIGTTVSLTLLGVVAGSNPAIQEFVRASEPYPEARLPYRWIAPVGIVTGAFTGLMLGAGNMILAALVGMVIGALP